jgi:hypothetical protein
MKKETTEIGQDIINTIMERPYSFEVNGRTLYLYPNTLGKSLLISELLKGADINSKNIRLNPLAEALRVCLAKKDEVCRIIAIRTLRTKKDVFCASLVAKRVKIISELSMDDLAVLLVAALKDDDIDRYIKHFGIDEERKWQDKAMKVKNDRNTLTFGGRSIYGTLIDNACQRYGWTFEYVVWGISYTNLKMLMADVVNTVFLTDEERKRVHIPNDRNVINMDNAQSSIELIKKMNWD